jgi:hypothetical protein
MIKRIESSDKVLEELVISYRSGVTESNAEVWSRDLGKFPYLVFAYGQKLVLEAKDIIYFKLTGDQYIPEIQVIFRDPTNKLIDDNFPLDKSIVSLMIKSDSDSLMPIRCDFYITNFNPVKDKSYGEDKIYTMKAILDLPIIIKNISFSKMTSFKVLGKIAKDCLLGFVSNIDDTEDEMTWINPGDDYIKHFVPEVVSQAYKNDDSFLWAFVDYYYNLNYVDIETALNEDTTNQMTILNTKDTIGTEETVKLILTNHPDKKHSNLFIERWNLVNDSTEINMDIGYEPYIYYFDDLNNKFVYLLIDTISTTGNDKILLRQRNDDINTNAGNVQQKKKYFMGKQDTDNVHDNFLYAQVQNNNNIKSLQKIKINVVLPNPNFSLYRFQNVEVVLYDLNDMEAKKGKSDNSVKQTITNENRVNNRLSGKWLITGINWIFDKQYMKSGGQTVFRQEVTLVRRDLSTLYTSTLNTGDSGGSSNLA